ncbi:MAG: helix-turn-helix transcriptional regulator [Elusimicrobiota bacterium]
MESIREKRRRLGLSQRELARRAGVAYKTLQLLEAGGHNPRWSTLAKIAEALGATVSSLQGEKASPARAGSIAEASARIVREGEDSWRLALFEFVDAFRRRPSCDLVAEGPHPGLSHRLHALLCATVERLCAEQGVAVPWWCAGVPPVPDPWFVAGIENLKATALVESPASFRQRNIFVLGNFLSRA